MLSDRVETVRRLADAVNRGDRKAAFARMAPDMVWNATGVLPGGKVHYNGRDEVWAFLRSLDESFEALSVDLESIEEVGKLVVARVHIHVTERAGGAESDFNFSSVGRFAQGKIARVENYLDHDEAMNDAELRAAES